MTTQSVRNEISVYNDSVANLKTVSVEVAKLKISFPKIEAGFCQILTERLVANNFTEQRLKDAISYLLDNFKYQTPTIADIINFDRKIKLYSYNEVVLLIHEDKAVFGDFYRHWIGDVLYRVKKSEAEFFNLTKYLNQGETK